MVKLEFFEKRFKYGFLGQDNGIYIDIFWLFRLMSMCIGRSRQPRRINRKNPFVRLTGIYAARASNSTCKTSFLLALRKKSGPKENGSSDTKAIA